MTFEDEVSGIKKEFEGALGSIELKGEIIEATNAKGDITCFKKPDDNEHERIIGWFWAGIWDYIGMSDQRIPLDAKTLDYSSGWKFYRKEALMIKNLSSKANHYLAYKQETDELFLQEPYFPLQSVGKSVGNSIFHLVKKFQENGWFEPDESQIESREISDYVVKCK